MAKDPYSVRRRKHWTPEEEDRLLWLWADNPLHVIARELGRTPKGVSIHARAELGLSTKRTTLVSLATAARRSGMYVDRLRKLLKEAGVRFWPSHNRVISGMGPKSVQTGVRVKWEAVEEVVKAFLSKYTIRDAAEQFNIHPTTMKRIMIRAGHEPPKLKNQPWRVNLEDARAAFEAYVKSAPRHAKNMRPYRKSGRTSSRSSSSCSNR